MRTIINDKKKTALMMTLFFFVYFTSYLTRNNFGAVLQGIIDKEGAKGFTKATLGVVLTVSFITYGSGQMISGFIGDRIQPKLLLIAGLFVSCAMNVLVPFMPNTTALCFVWGVNGFAQAFMWPPLVKLMASLFEKENYDRAVTVVSSGGMVGTIANYLIAFIFVSKLNWKAVFFFSAIAGVVMAVVLMLFCPKVPLFVRENKRIEGLPEVKTNGTKWLSFTLVIIMIIIVLQGSLRDGIASFMPTYVKDEFNLGDNVSILTGVLMPILGILSVMVASKLHSKKFHNPATCAGVIFIPASLCAAVIILPAVFGLNIGVVLTVVCMALLTGCMHGINMMLVSIVPKHFTYTGKVSLISGILNAFTYIGSAMSTYCYPIIEVAGGLNWVKIVWAITALLGTLLCFVVSKPFKKKYMN